MKKVIYILPVLTAAAVLLCTSCELLSESLPSYFNEYTNTAAVAGLSFDGSYPKNSQNITCIPSGSARVITLTLRNPQKYTLECGYSFSGTAASEQAAKLAASGIVPVVFTENEDTTAIEASVSEDMLYVLDQGTDKDLTFTVSLTESVSKRTFRSYTIPVHADSVPPEADGSVVMVSAANTYIVCFNMPSASKMNTNGIHGDIVSVSVNGTSYPLTVDRTAGTFAFTDTAGVITQTAPSGMTANTTSGTSLSFTSKGQPVYFLTADTLSDEDKTYAVQITDSAGLSSSVTTSVKAAKLGSVYLTDASGTAITDVSSLSQDEDSSYSTVTINPPAASDNISGVSIDTSDAKVLYEVYKGTDSTGTLLFEGESSGGSVTLKLPAGKVYISAYARKPLWADSDTLADSCKVIATRVFVNPAFTGTSTGSRDYPFTTISAAFSALDDKTSSANTITLLGNVTENIDLSDTTIYTAPAYTASIKSDTAAASADQNTTLTGTVVITGGSSLCFKNITLNGGNASDTAGAAVTVNENAVLTADGTTRVSGGYVYLDNDVQTGNTPGAIVTGSSFSVSGIDVSAGGYALLIKPAVYTGSVLGSLAEVTDSSGTLAQTTANVFAVMQNGTDSYYIYSLNGKGYITLRGSFVSVAFGSDYSTVTLNETSSSYTAGSGLTVTLGTSVPSGTVITAATVNNLNGKEAVAGTVASGGQSAAVTLPSSPAVYELYVTGTVPYGSGTMTWSASKEITVVYGTK